jgi:hypothetical protein
MKETLNFKIRKAKGEDIDYITSTWLRSVYEHSRHDFKKDVFYPNHNRMIKERLPFLKCLVACNPEDEDQIYGYLVFNPGVVHFAYTKSFFRRFGVFNGLIKEAGINPVEIHASHKGPMYEFLKSKHQIIFNPYQFIEVTK